MASTISAGTTSGTAIAIAGDTSGQLQLQTNNGTTAVTIDTSQRVAFVAGTAALPAITTTGDTNTGIFFPAADTIAFAEGGAESMRIDSSGNVGIGTTTPNSKLAVIGNVYVDSYLGVGTTPASTAMVTVDAALNARDGIRLSTNNSPASGSFISFRNLSGNVAGSITHTGTTTVAYNTSSDYRLKENIAPMVGALAKVQALKPCTYTWKEDGTDGQGFIAHELAEVCPQAVTFEKDAVDDEGNPKYQGIDTSFLVATLTAAIQELNAKVDAQAVTIATLQARNRP
jgi:hypothetical protein